MALNDVYRASTIWDIPGADGKCVFTMHYRTKTLAVAVGDPVEAQEIALEAIQVLLALYIPLVSDQFILESVKVIGISNPLIGVEAPALLSGVVVGDYLPLRSSPVIKLKTGLRGRSYNGRMFLLPPPETQQNGGVMTPGQTAALLAFTAGYVELTAPGTLNVYEGVIYSKVLSVGTGFTVSNAITNFLVNDTLGSLRGRQTV